MNSNKYFTSICCLCLPAIFLAQSSLQTENNLGVEDLIKDIFIKGNCKNVSNITAIGDEIISIGQFKNGVNIININDGIILSTGDIALAQGPNISSEASYSFDSYSTDPDLSRLATDSLFDATGIEFDFVPLNEKVTFRYVFASEEYCEFVGSPFNDVFGFFVSGPGINGTFENNAINVATLIGTNEDVSINTVNHLSNTNFYIDNVTNLDAENCMIISNPAAQDEIEYDGYTIRLTASFQVIPCETYHIRLIIGDVGDDALDSAVFLESKSFDLGEKVNLRAEVLGRDEPIAYEDCVDGQFVFKRSSLTDINEDCTIEYSISPESTATNGVDFLEIPMSITIAAGDTNFILPITIINDNITEGTENLKLQFEYECDCIDPSQSELFINDPPVELSINLDDATACANQAFTLTPEVTDGVPPFNMLWETGEMTDSLEVIATEPTNYKVTVTDFCGNTDSITAEIGVQEIPTATLMGDYDLCEIVDVGIPVQMGGNPPWKIQYSIDGIEQTPIENIQTNPFFLNSTTEGTYALTAFNDSFCEGRFTGSADVEYSSFDISTEVVAPTCLNSADGSIEITQLDAIAPFSIDWNIETPDERFLQNLKAGIYTLNILNGEGCLYKKDFDLTATSSNDEACVPIYIPNSFSPNNDGINDIFTVFYNPLNGIENIISMQIYNRWGSLIFEEANFISDNGTSGWSGDFNGKPLDTGVYVYKIQVAFEDGSTQLLSGDVTLFR